MRSVLLLSVFLLSVNCTADSYKNRVLVEIPFELRDDLIHIEIQVNDRKHLDFIFDTGASITLISQNAGNELGLNNGAVVNQTGAAGEHTVELFFGQYMTIGEEVISDINLLKSSIELPRTSALEEEADGIIGFDILSNYVVQIDYVSLKLTLYDMDQYNNNDLGDTYSFVKPFDIPMVKVTINSAGTEYDGVFIVDTGATVNAVLNAPFVKKNKLMDHIGKHYSINHQVGISGETMKLSLGRMDQLTFLDKKFTHVPIALSHATNGALSYNTFQGVIGNGLIRRFHIVFNYKKNEIYAYPNHDFHEVFRTDCLGVTFNNKKLKVLIVKEVIPGSAAERGGIQTNDRFVQVNGRDVYGYEFEELKNIFSNAGGQIIIRLIRNGKELEIELTLNSLI